ncbi:hypothetical protein P7K49_029521 [Saguinus oedipus]|uniref:Uncharacterized protein n=1 Tax=Saguinus oedipus TaxID=9490 RepID=A0ABQ9U9G1_SAGOE|nr:hypothetical protein P7K49_029521 [Saguinus oedipus]
MGSIETVWVFCMGEAHLPHIPLKDLPGLQPALEFTVDTKVSRLQGHASNCSSKMRHRKIGEQGPWMMGASIYHVLMTLALAIGQEQGAVKKRAVSQQPSNSVPLTSFPTQPSSKLSSETY